MTIQQNLLIQSVSEILEDLFKKTANDNDDRFTNRKTD